MATTRVRKKLNLLMANDKLNDVERFRTTSKVRKELNLLRITHDFKRKHDLIVWMLNTFTVPPEKGEGERDGKSFN